MKELLSPKQVAASIGVSESSLKRWCDQGVLATERTPGGHRRIRIAEVVRFLRERDQEIVRPDLLGLPPGMGRSPRSVDRARDELVAALKDGDATVCRRITLEVFLSGASVVKLCEELITPAMHAIGKGWECGDLEVFQEHRASEVVNRVLYDLRSFLPPPEPGAPVAVGGTPPGDHYRLATLVVELTLLEAGWNAISLGSSLPFQTMASAAKRYQPDLFWLSLSHIGDPGSLATDFEQFLEAVPEQTHIVIGGQRIGAIGEKSDRVHRCESLTALRDLVAGLRPAA